MLQLERVRVSVLVPTLDTARDGVRVVREAVASTLEQPLSLYAPKV